MKQLRSLELGIVLGLALLTLGSLASADPIRRNDGIIGKAIAKKLADFEESTAKEKLTPKQFNDRYLTLAKEVYEMRSACRQLPAAFDALSPLTEAQFKQHRTNINGSASRFLRLNDDERCQIQRYCANARVMVERTFKKSADPADDRFGAHSFRKGPPQLGKQLPREVSYKKSVEVSLYESGEEICRLAERLMRYPDAVNDAIESTTQYNERQDLLRVLSYLDRDQLAQAVLQEESARNQGQLTPYTPPPALADHLRKTREQLIGDWAAAQRKNIEAALKQQPGIDIDRLNRNLDLAVKDALSPTPRFFQAQVLESPGDDKAVVALIPTDELRRLQTKQILHYGTYQVLEQINTGRALPFVLPHSPAEHFVQFLRLGDTSPQTLRTNLPPSGLADALSPKAIANYIPVGRILGYVRTAINNGPKVIDGVSKALFNADPGLHDLIHGPKRQEGVGNRPESGFAASVRKNLEPRDTRIAKLTPTLPALSLPEDGAWGAVKQINERLGEDAANAVFERWQELGKALTNDRSRSQFLEQLERIVEDPENVTASELARLLDWLRNNGVDDMTARSLLADSRIGVPIGALPKAQIAKGSAKQGAGPSGGAPKAPPHGVTVASAVPVGPALGTPVTPALPKLFDPTPVTPPTPKHGVVKTGTGTGAPKAPPPPGKASSLTYSTIPAQCGPYFSAPGTVRLSVPSPSARVTFDGTATTQAGSQRQYVTPTLDRCRAYTYQIAVTWRDASGVERTARRAVQISGGQTVDVAVTSPDASTDVAHARPGNGSSAAAAKGTDAACRRQPRAPARIQVSLSDPSTVVLLDGTPTTSTGAEREYVTPDLDPCRNFTYTLTTRRQVWSTAQGQWVTQSQDRTVRVRAGEISTVSVN